MGRSVQGAETEAGPGAHAFIRVLGGMLWGSPAKTGFANSNQKGQWFQ